MENPLSRYTTFGGYQSSSSSYVYHIFIIISYVLYLVCAAQCVYISFSNLTLTAIPKPALQPGSVRNGKTTTHYDNIYNCILIKIGVNLHGTCLCILYTYIYIYCYIPSKCDFLTVCSAGRAP